MEFELITSEILDEVYTMIKESRETSKTNSLKEELLKEFDEYGMGFDGEDENEYKDIADDEAGADDEEFKMTAEIEEMDETEGGEEVGNIHEETESPEYIEAFGYLIDNVADVTEEELNSMPHDILIDMYNMIANKE